MKSYWGVVNSDYISNHYDQYSVVAATVLFQIPSYVRCDIGFQIHFIYLQIIPVLFLLYHDAAFSSEERRERGLMWVEVLINLCRSRKE